MFNLQEIARFTALNGNELGEYEVIREQLHKELRKRILQNECS